MTEIGKETTASPWSSSSAASESRLLPIFHPASKQALVHSVRALIDVDEMVDTIEANIRQV